MLNRNRNSHALASIDISAADRELAENAAAASEISDAIAKAERQRDQVTGEINRIRQGDEVDRRQVADALLAGADVMEVHEPIEALQARRTALQAGIRELNERARALNDERSRIKETVSSALSEAAAPLVDQVHERAAAAMRELVRAYADAKAIHAATSSSGAAALIRKLNEDDDFGHVEALAYEFGLGRLKLIAKPSPDIVTQLRVGEAAIRLSGHSVPAATRKFALPV